MTTSAALAPGLHRGIPMSEYLALEGIGSTALEWLSISPLHFRYMSEQPREETAATFLGTALHSAVLEPETFDFRYSPEPAIEGYEKPRATNAYKAAVKELADLGKVVLRAETMDAVRAMTESIMRHPEAKRVLARAPEREVTMLWERDGRLCRGRADALGDGILADVKTTRSLRDFSPWVITRLGYYRQMAHEEYGLEVLGHPIKVIFLIAVENTAPYDVGVFTLDDPARIYGASECKLLFERLTQCELTGHWPGMFPKLETGTVTDRLAEAMAGVED